MSAQEPAGANAPVTSGRDADPDPALAALADARRRCDALQEEALQAYGVARREEKLRAALERRLRRAEMRNVELERSSSYRLGHAIIIIIKSPLFVLRWLAVHLVRLLARVIPEEARRWISERTPEFIRTRVRSASRTRTTRTSSRDLAAYEGATTDVISSGVLDAVRGRDRLIVFAVAPTPAGDVRGLIDAILTLQKAQSMVPVFVTQSDDLLPYRQAGVAFEYLPPRDEWVASGMPGTWQAFYDDRIQEIRRSYDADDVVVLSAEPATLRSQVDLLYPLLRSD